MNDAVNVVVVCGVLSRPAERRVLPSGDSVVGYEVTVREADGPAATVPVAWAEAPDEAMWPAGQAVVVVGRVRRRYFRAGGATSSRTEVVADVVLPASARARSTRAVAAALARVGLPASS